MINTIKQSFFNKSFIIYGAIGVTVTILQIASLFLFRNFFLWPDFISITAAYIIALILHYFLNKHITFKISDKKVFNMMSVRYVMVVIISYLIYMFNIFLLNNIIGLSFEISLILTLGINYVINYILYEKIVFKKK